MDNKKNIVGKKYFLFLFVFVSVLTLVGLHVFNESEISGDIVEQEVFGFSANALAPEISDNTVTSLPTMDKQEIKERSKISLVPGMTGRAVTSLEGEKVVDEDYIVENEGYTVYRGQIVAGQPVRWVAVMNKTDSLSNLEVKIPKGAKGITILKDSKEIEDAIEKIKDKNSNVTNESLEDLFEGGEWEPVVESRGGIIGRIQSAFSITGNVIGEKRAIDDGELSVKNDEVFVDFDGDIEEEIVAVSYVTSAPEYEAVDVEDGKVVVISAAEELEYTDVLASATFDTQIEGLENARNIRVVWHENENLIDKMDLLGEQEFKFSLENFLDAGLFTDIAIATKDISETESTGKESVGKLVDFVANDTDGDGYIDYVEWVVPHLSEQSYELIIEIVDAEHLNEDREILGNVYEELQTLDNITYEIPEGDFLRVYFVINLSYGNDITIYADADEGVTVEAYEVGSDELLFTFTNITDFERNRIMFENVSNEWKQDTFDLRSVGGTVIYDWVVDACTDNSDCVASKYCVNSDECGVLPYGLCWDVSNCKGQYSPSSCGQSWTTTDHNNVCADYWQCYADKCTSVDWSGLCTGTGLACAGLSYNCAWGKYCTSGNGCTSSGYCDTTDYCSGDGYYAGDRCSSGDCDSGYSFTACADASCTGSGDSYTQKTDSTCSSASCTSQSSSGCGVYTCNGGGSSGSACDTNCVTNNDAYCISSYHCYSGDNLCYTDANGGACDLDSECTSGRCDSTCQAKLADGNTCDETSDCTSGYCDNDGVGLADDLKCFTPYNTYFDGQETSYCEISTGSGTANCDERLGNACADTATETVSWAQSTVADEKCSSVCADSTCDATCCESAASSATVENAESCTDAKCTGTCSGANCLVQINNGYTDCDVDGVCLSGDCFQVNAASADSNACDTSSGAICDGNQDSDMCVTTGSCVYDSNYDGTIVTGEYVANGAVTEDVDNDGDLDYCSSGVWIDCYNDNHCNTANSYYCSLSDCVIDLCVKSSDCPRGKYCSDGYCVSDTTNPTVAFVPPTLADEGKELTTSYFFNTSIWDSTLENIIIDWNGTNSTIYMANDDGLILAMDFDSDSDYLDWSGEDNDGTCAGDACPTYSSSGKIGGAMMFGGINDNISISYDSSLNVNEFSVSAWVKADAVPTGEHGIFGTRFGGEYTFDMKATATNIHGDIGDGTAWIDTTADCSLILDTTNWHHIVYTVDSDGYFIYVDNDLCNSESFTSGTPLLMQSGQTMKIGAGSVSEYFNGSIDEVRVFNKVIDADEVSALYKNKLREPTTTNYCFREGFCNDTFKDVGNTNGLVLGISFDDSSDFSDWSGEGNDGTNTGSTWKAKGRVGGARSFDGSNDYITVSRDSSLEPAEFTLSAWININQNTAYNVLFSKDYTSHVQPYYSYHLRTYDDGIYFGWNDGSAGSGITSGTGPLPINKWMHIVATHKSGEQKIYKDGAEVASRALTGTISYYATDLIIGDARNFVGYFDGEMDEARIYNRSLSADEIFNLYKGSAYLFDNYNYSDDGDLGTVEYNINFNEPNSFNDLSSNDYTSTNYGTIWNKNGFVNGGRSFDGTDDYISIPAAAGNYGTGDFGVSFWFNVNSLDTSEIDQLVCKRNSTANSFEVQIQTNGYLRGYMKTPTGDITFESLDSLDAGRWYHALMTRVSGVAYLYLDGTFQSSASASGNVDSSAGISFGRDVENGLEHFGGRMDEVKIFSTGLSASDVETLYNNSLLARDTLFLEVNKTNLTLGGYSYNVYVDDEADYSAAETERDVWIAECAVNSDCSSGWYCSSAGICVDIDDPSSYRFELENSVGAKIAFVDDKGDMYLNGTVSVSQGSLSPPVGSFVIKNNADVTVGYFDNSGNLKLAGTVDVNSDLSGFGTKMEFRNSSDNLVAFFDNSGNLKLQGGYLESYTF